MKTHSGDPPREHRFAYEGLDRVIHERARLGVLTSLATHPDGLLFVDLKALCNLTDGNLSRQLQVLESAKLVEVTKAPKHGRAQTVYRLTRQGRKRYLEYLTVLEQVIRDSASPATDESDGEAARHMVRISLLALLLASQCAHANGGPFGIDYELSYDNAGIWKRSYQLDLEYAVLATTGIGALWLGNDNPRSHAFWQDIDSEAISAVVADGLKYAFSRARPSQGDNPNLWFQGHGDESFPSGEVTLQAAFVTPSPSTMYGRMRGSPRSRCCHSTMRSGA